MASVVAKAAAEKASASQHQKPRKQEPKPTEPEELEDEEVEASEGEEASEYEEVEESGEEEGEEEEGEEEEEEEEEEREEGEEHESGEEYEEADGSEAEEEEEPESGEEVEEDGEEEEEEGSEAEEEEEPEPAPKPKTKAPSKAAPKTNGTKGAAKAKSAKGEDHEEKPKPAKKTPAGASKTAKAGEHHEEPTKAAAGHKVAAKAPSSKAGSKPALKAKGAKAAPATGKDKPWKSGNKSEGGISPEQRGLQAMWPFIAHMKMADGNDKNDISLSNENVLKAVGQLFEMSWHKFMSEVEELSPGTDDDVLTIVEVNTYLRSVEKQVIFYEIQGKFDFDEWVEEAGHEKLGILYMRADKSGHCVSWEQGKGFLDYSKSKSPKPNAKDGDKDIKTMIELVFTIEDCDWADEETEKTPQKSKAGEPVAGKKPAASKKKAGDAVAPKKKALATRPKAKKPAAEHEEPEAPRKPVVKKKAPLKKPVKKSVPEEE